MEDNFPRNHMLPGAGTLGAVLAALEYLDIKFTMKEAGRNLYVGSLTEYSYKLL